MAKKKKKQEYQEYIKYKEENNLRNKIRKLIGKHPIIRLS